MSRDNLLEQILESIRANRVNSELLDERVARYLGVNVTDRRALEVIDRSGRITAGALAAELRMSTGAATTIVDRLEQRGFAVRVRDEVDRRRVFIEATDEARRNSRLLYGDPDVPGPGLDDFSDAELEVALRYEHTYRAWIEERLTHLGELEAKQAEPPSRTAAKT